jgi:uncharacterized protein YggE
VDLRPTVVVRAHARRPVTADTFIVSVTVDVQAEDPSDAATRLSVGFTTLEQTLGPLAAPGLTVDYGPVSIRRETQLPADAAEPVTRWRGSRPATLTGTEPARVEPVMAAVARLMDSMVGLDLGGPFWQVSDDHEAHAMVQADAVRAARSRAARYAETAGGRLGALVELGDTDVAAGRPVRAAAAYAREASGYISLATMDYSPAQLELNATVEGRWLIEFGSTSGPADAS